MNRRRLIIPLLKIFLACAAAISVYQALVGALAPNGSQDTQWSGSRVLLNGSNPYKAYLDQPRDPTYILTQAPNYPPHAFLIFTPLAILPWSFAKVAWATINLLLVPILFWSLLQLFPHIPKSSRLYLVTIFLSSGTFRFGFSVGQHALFAVTMFTLSMVLARRHNGLTSLALACAWFKWTVTLPLSLVLLRERKGKWLLQSSALVAVAAAGVAYATRSTFIETATGPLGVAAIANPRGFVDVFSAARELGLEHKVVPIATSMFLVCIGVFVALRDEDLLSMLCTLSLTSMLFIFHLGYDSIVWIFLLVFCFVHGLTSARARLYALLLGTIWFGNKALNDALRPLAELTNCDWAFWLKFGLVVLALAVDLLVLLRSLNRKPAVRSVA